MNAMDSAISVPDSYESENLGGHGNDFQRRLALLLVLRATLTGRRFKLGIEMKHCAGKFDDIVFLDEKSQEWWLIQTKHSLHSQLTEGMLFADGGGDFALLKYFKSYLHVIEPGNWPHGGKSFKFFLATNKTLHLSIKTVTANVDDIMLWPGGKAQHVHLNPDANQLLAVESLINRDFDLICSAIASLFTKKEVHPILDRFKIPLSNVLVKSGKMITFSQCFNDQHQDWRVRKLYKTVKSKFENENSNIETATVLISKEMKNFWTKTSRDKDKEMLLPLVTREIIGNFFNDFILSIAQPNAEDLVGLIDDMGRRWMKSWIRPDIYRMLTEHETSTFDIFRKCFEEWEQPLQSVKVRRFLCLEDGENYLATAKEKRDQPFQSFSKLFRSGLEAPDDSYINRQLQCPVEVNKSSDSPYFAQPSRIQDEEMIDQLYEKFKDHRRILLIAEPGMGKSTLWQHLSFYTQRKYPKVAVFLLCLNRLVGKLSDSSAMKSGFYILDAMLSEDNVEVIRSGTSDIVLFIDALDELDSCNIDEVLKLIQVLSASRKNIKILLSSRGRIQELIEKSLEVKTISLLPFDDRDQKDFLRKIWNVSPGSDTEKFDGFSTKLLNKIRRDIPSSIQNFIGMPLTMRMLAEIYMNSFLEYFPNNTELDETFGGSEHSIVQLFDQFTTKRVILQYKKCHNIDSVEKVIMKTFREQIEADQRKYELLALKLLLSADQLSEISESDFESSINSIMSNIREGCAESLLLETIKGKPRCSHRSFAEYYAARYLRKYIDRDSNSEEFARLTSTIHTILSDNEGIRKFMLAMINRKHTANQLAVVKKMDIIWLCKANSFNLVRYFWEEHDFDRNTMNFEQLSASMLHAATDSNALETLEFVLTKAANVDCKDSLGRTSLCLAAERGHTEIAQCLVKRSADVESRDGCGKTPLHWAAEYGYREFVQLLLDQGADVNSVDHTTRDMIGRYELTPLHLAALNGHVDIIEVLISRGANVNTIGANGSSPLALAVLRCHIESSFMLISKGADVNSIDDDGRTPLFLAVSRACSEIAEMLIAKGADVNKGNKVGNTPLHLAALCDRRGLLELLIARGASVNSVDNYNGTPLHSAACNGHKEAIELLILNGANVNALDETGRTALHLALWRMHGQAAKYLISEGADIHRIDDTGRTALHSAVLNGHKEMAELLIMEGAAVDSIDNNGCTPLHLAVLKSCKDLVELLLAHGAGINAASKNGNTALHVAAGIGDRNLVELLISKEAAINAASDDRRTPLHFAVTDGHKNATELLISKGAHVNAENKKRITPLHLAAREGHSDVVEILLLNGAALNAVDDDGKSPFLYAAWNGHKGSVELLIQHGADINLTGRKRITSIHLAAGAGHTELVELLLTKGADVNAESVDRSTPLHSAAWNGHKETAKLLISKGTYVNPVSTDRSTPLHFAAWNGHENTAELLLAEGANVNAVGKRGKTPFHLACWNGHTATVELLISKGASINSIDADGKTALHLATAEGHMVIVKLLIAHGANVNAADRKQSTSIHSAAVVGRCELVELLISNGAAIEPTRDDGSTPLHLAAWYGHADIAELLISKGANVNAAGQKGKTPLHLASWNGHRNTVELLVAKGAAINAVDDDGSTPRHLAATRKQRDMVGLLISMGAEW